jgi:hypothetical protein
MITSGGGMHGNDLMDPALVSVVLPDVVPPVGCSTLGDCVLQRIALAGRHDPVRT